jgi:hypothetical protein
VARSIVALTGAMRAYRALGRSVEASALQARWSRLREAALGSEAAERRASRRIG